MKEVLSKPTPETDETQSREARVSVIAYQIWEEEGRPHGRHDIHWQLACEMVDAEDLAKEPPPTWLHRQDDKPAATREPKKSAA
jgi:hypothetical protein